MKILFLGANTGTGRNRFRALDRMGHKARLIDPRQFLPSWDLIDRIEWQLHPGPLCAWIRPQAMRAIDGERFDLAFVDGGSLVGADLVFDLKKCCDRVVNFNQDDPFGRRDGPRFAAYRAAVPFYDLIVVVRKENVSEATQLGAKRILRSFMVADDVEHVPMQIAPEERKRWASDVAFIGTWMPERGPLLARLRQLGVPLVIFGNRWQRAPEWNVLRSAWRSPGVEFDEYRLAVQCAKICLGLVSKGNRDQHTTRSMEIPSLGSVLCAERTQEHVELYLDGTEAVFWDTPEECADHCRALLKDEVRLRSIARDGRDRFLRNGHTTEQLLRRIIDEAFR